MGRPPRSSRWARSSTWSAPSTGRSTWKPSPPSGSTTSRRASGASAVTGPPRPPRAPCSSSCRASDDVLLKGKRVPFANQLEDIARTVTTRANGREVVAVFWDCESGSDFRGGRSWKRAIARAAFETCLAEAASPEAPCAELWVWRSDRLARGWRYLPQLMELQARRVALMAATGRIRRDFLPLEIRRWRSGSGITGAAGRWWANARWPNGTPCPPRGASRSAGGPSGATSPPSTAPTTASPTTRRRCRPETALTGRASGVDVGAGERPPQSQRGKRLADRDQQTDARALAWNPRIVRKSLTNHGWWVGQGRWTDTPMDVDEDGEEVESAPVRLAFSVPPAMIDDPGLGPYPAGRRPLTEDDLAVIGGCGERRRGRVGQGGAREASALRAGGLRRVRAHAAVPAGA